MKTTIYLILLATFLNVKPVRAQGMPVFDLSNVLALTEQITATGALVTETMKGVKILQEQKENIERVSNAIRTINQISRLLERQNRIAGILNNDIRRIMQNPNISVREGISLYDKGNRLLDITMEDVRLMEQILQDSFIKMEDADRMENLRLAEKTAAMALLEIEFEIDQYDQAIAFRELQTAINQMQRN